MASSSRIVFSQTERAPGVINFAIGTPGPDLIPKKAIDAAFTSAISENQDPLMYQYALSEGTSPFRKSLAKFLTEQNFSYEGGAVQEENLSATFGNSLGLVTVSKLFAKPGDIVVVEDPTYFLAGKMFQDQGLRCVRVGVDEHGLKVDDLEGWLSSTTVRPSLLYSIPRHHNPTSRCLSQDRGDKLIALAEKYGFKIVFDDPYSLLTYSQNVAPPQTRITEHVISLGSFSKILTPGLRLGWMIGGPKTIEKIGTDGALNSGGGPAGVLTEAVRRLIDNGSLNLHLEMLRKELGERHKVLEQAFEEEFGPGVASCRPALGGYFTYASFKEASVTPGFTTAGLRQHCVDTNAGVLFMPVANCAVADPIAEGEGGFGLVPGLDTHSSRLALRLAVSQFTPGELREGVTRLAKAFQTFRPSP